MNFIQTDNRFLRTKEFIKFRLSNKSVVYDFLKAAIIRESKSVNLNAGIKYIYHNYFKEGKLVSRYPQNLISEYMGMSQSAISQHITALVKDGFIRVYSRKTGKGIFKYYEFGVWDGKWGTNSYKEIYYLDEYFIKAYKKEKEERDSKKYNIEQIHESELFSTAAEYVYAKMKEKGDSLTVEEIETYEVEWANHN
jgi:DNA-binding transcriptional ArsR family regulator